MKYTFARLGLFVIVCLGILIGTSLVEFYPGIEIAMWLITPIFAALVALGASKINEAQTSEGVRKVLEKDE